MSSHVTPDPAANFARPRATRQDPSGPRAAESNSADQRASERKAVGIIIGDPNGIGPEIALKAALDVSLEATAPRLVLIGDSHVIERTARTLHLTPEEQQRYEVMDVAALAPDAWQPGRVDARAGAATVAYVKAGVQLCLEGKLHALAACPHSETAVNAAGISFSGYPGLVADLTTTPRQEVFLMLEAAGLRVVHVTVHERLIDAVSRITPELVVDATRAAVATVRRMGIEQPRVCVLGINPHAGENGLFGDDDERITRPAVARLREIGLAVDGPVGADLGLSERKHDVYVAMFHDQGHIAVKMLSPKGASAVAAGAPVLFASVGHGAAFDIAGQGCADASAMTATVRMLASVA